MVLFIIALAVVSSLSFLCGGLFIINAKNSIVHCENCNRYTQHTLKYKATCPECKTENFRSDSD